MRAEAVQAERRLEVREAAAGWHAADAIDDATLRAIEAAFPDDRVRLKFWIRALAFAATLIGCGALAALIASMLGVGAHTGMVGLLAALAVAAAASTEIQTGRLRRAQCGSEEATAFLAALFGSIACVLWWGPVSFEVFLVAAVVLCALGAWRWGSLILTGAAAISAFALAARSPHGRLLWLILAAAVVPIAYRASRSERVAPSHRRGAEVVLVACLIAAYVAINLYALDTNYVEMLGDRPWTHPPTWMRWIAGIGTALLPVTVFAAGVVLRSRMGLLLGAAFTAASLATLRHYHAIGPLWLMLTLGGSACFAIALGLRRTLSSAPGQELGGFTAEPLFESSRAREAAGIAAAAAMLGPSPRTTPPHSFEGGGGLSGGGGASGSA